MSWETSCFISNTVIPNINNLPQGRKGKCKNADFENLEVWKLGSIKTLLGPCQACPFSLVAMGTTISLSLLPFSPFRVANRDLQSSGWHRSCSQFQESAATPWISSMLLSSEVSQQWGKVVVTSFRRHWHNQVSWRCREGGTKPTEECILLSCPCETWSKKPFLSPAGVASLLPGFLFLAVRHFLHCSLTDPRTSSSIARILDKSFLSFCCYCGRHIF